jgi:hypothetical protein
MCSGTKSRSLLRQRWQDDTLCEPPSAPRLDDITVTSAKISTTETKTKPLRKYHISIASACMATSSKPQAIEIEIKSELPIPVALDAILWLRRQPFLKHATQLLSLVLPPEKSL